MSLKNLLALQKQAKAKPTESPAPVASPPVEASVESQTQATDSPPKPKGLGLNLVAASRAVATPKLAAEPAPAPSEPVTREPGEFSLEDLAGMDASMIDQYQAPERESDVPMFDDEIEATAPDRILPDDITTDMRAFVQTLDGIYTVLHDPEMFGQSVRLIMMELQENPEYDRLLSDPDVHTMIRGMRRTMGLARVRKQEKKRGAATKTNARKKAGVSDSAMSMLQKLMGDDE